MWYEIYVYIKQIIKHLTLIFKSQKTNNISQSNKAGNNTLQQQSGILNKQQNNYTIINSTPNQTWAEQNQAAKAICNAWDSYIYLLNSFTVSNYVKSAIDRQLRDGKKKFEKTLQENLPTLREHDQKVITNLTEPMFKIRDTEIAQRLPQIIKHTEELKSVLAQYLDTSN